jgi:hypothetical protein
MVIDKTDLYSPEQAAGIEQLVLDSRDQLEIGERLTLFELDARGALVNTNNFSLCNPGRGDQINPLYRNPQRVEARYQACLKARFRPPSPIWSSPRKARPARSWNRWRAWPSRRPSMTPSRHREIVLVSDMLQNSQLFSVYGRARGDLAERLPDPARSRRRSRMSMATRCWA